LLLRTRLQLSGDLSSDAAPGDIFDEVLDEAVRRLQRRHGLEVDGIVGPRTPAAQNLSAADRLASIELNLRRFAMLPLVGDGTQLLLNIAGAELIVLEDGGQIAVHRAIVGRRDWQTPLLTSAITRLDLNPAWTVPPRMVREELLPHMRRDPGYLGREGIVQMRDPQTGTVIYRQPPGPENPLGVVRFFFPNAYSVFLHDTPAKGLFDRAERTFSHGCVRVEGALELALYLLREEPGWSAERVAAVLATQMTRRVDLTRPVPITLAYLTAWVDGSGVLHFREDVYGRDGRDKVVLAAVQTACGS
jgi:murein L,D-transpeptidase YcbB/YkuD